MRVGRDASDLLQQVYVTSADDIVVVVVVVARIAAVVPWGCCVTRLATAAIIQHAAFYVCTGT